MQWAVAAPRLAGARAISTPPEHQAHILLTAKQTHSIGHFIN